MDMILEQMPIVIPALNAGFVQTLKLFAVTLVGALPLGLLIAFGAMSKFKPLSLFTKLIIWIVRGTPLMIQLLIIYFFPGLVLKNPIWGSGESGRFLAASVAFIFNYACYFAEIYRGGIQSVPVGQEEAGLVLGMTRTQIFFQNKVPSDGEANCTAHCQRDHYSCKRYFSVTYHRITGSHLGRSGIYERKHGNCRSDLASVLYGNLLFGI